MFLMKSNILINYLVYFRDFLLFSGVLIDYSQLLVELMVNFGGPRRY